MLVDEADLEDGGFERMTAHDVVDVLRLAQQRADLATFVAREVRAHPRSEVGGLADVQHTPASIAKEVDTGRPGELGGELELAGLRVAAHGGQREQVVEADDPEPGRPFEEQVQEVAGGEGVVEGPVGGRVAQAEPGRRGCRA